MSNQIEMISLDLLVPEDHTYRKTTQLVDFKGVLKLLNRLRKKIGSYAYGVEVLFKCILLQFMESFAFNAKRLVVLQTG